jgi:hypothetical protein
MSSLPVISHGVAVCPGWECNSRMDRSEVAQLWGCVNGHVWSDEQFARGDTRRPWGRRRWAR